MKPNSFRDDMYSDPKKDIFFLQRGFAHYRNHFFRTLSQRHDIHFLFLSSSSAYPGMIAPVGFSSFFLNHGSRIIFFRLVFYLLKHRPNIVISSTSYSMRSIVSFLYASLFRKRFILWTEEWQDRKYSSDTLKRHWRHIRYLIGVKIIKYAKSLVVGGSAAKNYAMSLGKNEPHIFTAINCANDLKLKQDSKYNKKTSRPGKYTFLYLSRIIPRKGLDILLKAFSLAINPL